MPVYQIKREMPLAEMIGWHRHLADKNKEPEPIDLSEMKQEDIARMFGA